MLKQQPQVAAVEERLYNWMTLIAAVGPMISAVPVNVALGITPLQTLALVAFSAVSGVLYWFARQGRRYPVPFAALLVGIANISWFTDAGADGATTQWIAFVSALLVLLLTGRTRWIAVGGFILNGFGLLWIDYRYPDFIPRMATRADRYLDLASGFPVATIIFGLVFAVVFDAYRAERNRLADTNAQLEKSLAEIRTLRGLLPICGWCKKIRDGEGWVQVEKFVSERSQAQFTHSICAECESHLVDEGAAGPQA